MNRQKIQRAIALFACAFLYAGCSHASTEVSPLVGSWKINGGGATSSPDFPQFTSLTFKGDGTLQASYVATNGALARAVQGSPQTKDENDTYTLGESSALHIAEGSRSLDYTYDIRDNKLFLTPSNEANAIVYARVAGT